MRFKTPPIVKLLVPILIVLLLLPELSLAQSYNKSTSFRPYWMFNVNAGTSLFFGDIKQYRIAPVSSNENEWRFGVGTMLGMQISPIFGVRGQFLYGNLAGTRREWNVFFESNYIEFNLNGTIGLRNIFQQYKYNQVWNAYLLMGIGLTNFNTEVKDLQTKQVIKSVGNGSGKSFGGRTLQGMLVGGIGLDFRISNRINVNLETANRILNTDELDGRTSGFKYDVYNYTSFGISYKFGGNSARAPRVKEEYSYFEKKKRIGDIETADYDYNPYKPISPPEVDVLTITPVVITTGGEPTKPPGEEKVVKEVQIIPVMPEGEVVEVVEEVVVTALEYRVQIRAKYGKKISIQFLSNTYNIPASDIREDTYNGFYIYSVGSFSTYDQAREKRNQIRTRNGISDAFVVAFRNGQRLNKLP